jgi:hypothetical protein
VLLSHVWGEKSVREKPCCLIPPIFGKSSSAFATVHLQSCHCSLRSSFVSPIFAGVYCRKGGKNEKDCLFLIILLIGVAIDADAKKARKFYLTKTEFTGSQPLTACAKKFHMASMWEIFDVSTLRYDTENGFTLDDSGSGPPTNFFGWVRTGFSSNNVSPSRICQS